MSAVPELVIPLNLDPSAAIAKLQALKGAAGESLDSTKKKTRETSEEMGLLGKGVQDAGNYLKSFVGFQAGMQAINMVAGGIADEMARVSKNINESTKKFSDFRKGMIEYAAITGKPLNNKMVADTIQGAKSSGVDPAKFVELQKAMLESVGGNIGNNITQKQFDEVTARLAPYAQARGLESGDVAGLAGMVMRNAKAGTSVDNIMSQFGRLFGVAEKGLGSTKQLLPEMVAAGAAGFDPTAGTISSAIYAQNGTPRMTSSFNDAHARLIQRMFTSGDKDESGNIVTSNASKLGLTMDMDYLQSAEQIYKKAKKAGVDTGNATSLGVWLKQYGNDDQKAAQAMNLFFKHGIEGGMLKDFRKASGASVNGNKVIDDAIKGFEGEDVGQEIIAENRAKVAEAMSGEKYVGLNKYLSRAKDKYFTSGKATEAGGIADVTRTIVGSITGEMYGSNEEQIQRAMARSEVYADAEKAGALAPGEFAKKGGSDRIGTMIGDKDEMLEILKRMEDHLAKANTQRGDAPKRPLQTKPPGAQ